MVVWEVGMKGDCWFGRGIEGVEHSRRGLGLGEVDMVGDGLGYYKGSNLE